MCMRIRSDISDPAIRRGRAAKTARFRQMLFGLGGEFSYLVEISAHNVLVNSYTVKRDNSHHWILSARNLLTVFLSIPPIDQSQMIYR